jgi:hypothetical protein
VCEDDVVAADGAGVFASLRFNPLLSHFSIRSFTRECSLAVHGRTERANDENGSKEDPKAEEVKLDRVS